jgi:hypothetical protein
MNRIRRSVFFVGLLFAALAAFTAPADLFAQAESGGGRGRRPYLSFAFDLKVDFATLGSDDIERRLRPFEPAGGFGFGGSLGLGIAELVQLGVRYEDSDHELSSGIEAQDPFGSGPFFRKRVIEMDFDATLLVLRVTPLRNRTRIRPAFTAGLGSCKYRDDSDDGFYDGSVQMLGLDLGFRSGMAWVSFGIERQSIQFEELRIAPRRIPVEYEAGRWILNMSASREVPLLYR